MILYSGEVSPFSRMCEIVARKGTIQSFTGRSPLTSNDPCQRVCKTENLEIKHVDLTFKEDWFKKINPKQLLPALQLDDGSVLTESVDICKYFCDQVGGNYLWPGKIFYFDGLHTSNLYA